MAKLDNLLKNRKALAFFSIALAFLMWLLVAVFFNTSSTNVIRRVPVEIDNASPAFQSAGVERVDLSTKTVDVTVQGDRSVIGRLTVADLSARAEINNITGAGEYTFRVTVERKDPLKNFSVVNPQSYTVKLTLGTMSTKAFKITPVMTEQATVEEGYVLGEVFTTPGAINIRGPKDAIDMVTQVRVNARPTGTLTETQVVSQKFSEVELYDKDNNLINKDSRFSSETANIDITIPVLKKATLPLRVHFLGAPSALDTDSLKYTLSHSEIKVAGPRDSIDKIREITVGYFDLRSFREGTTHTLDVALPTGFVATENVKQVTLEFDQTYEDGFYFTVSQINLKNIPDNYDISLDTQRIYSVRVAGDSGQLGRLTASDLVAEVDFSEIELTRGTVRVEAKISAPNYNGVWVLDTYKVDVVVQDR